MTGEEKNKRQKKLTNSAGTTEQDERHREQKCHDKKGKTGKGS